MAETETKTESAVPEEEIRALNEFRERMGFTAFIGVGFTEDGNAQIIGRARGHATNWQLRMFQHVKIALLALLSHNGATVDPDRTVDEVGPNHGKPVTVN